MITERVGLKDMGARHRSGCGFRPFVYTQAQQNHLTGWVRNTSSGVEIELCGTQTGLDAFLHSLQHHPPPLARIDELYSEPCPANGAQTFEIISSQSQEGDFIPFHRMYPSVLIASANCSIHPTGATATLSSTAPTAARVSASFKIFPMTGQKRPWLALRCAQTAGLNTKIHSIGVFMPNPWPARYVVRRCGLRAGVNARASAKKRLISPGAGSSRAKYWQLKVWVVFTWPAMPPTPRRSMSCAVARNALISLSPSWLSISLLWKSTAVYLSWSEICCFHTSTLIVLLERRPESTVAAAAAPHQVNLGVMLPYTPLHLLLLEPERGFPDMLVMTSGNLSEEPIAYEDADAMRRLEHLADGFLLHDRPIHMRVDDSVMRIAADAPYLLRRARGYAPDAVQLPFECHPFWQPAQN
jgi:hydrogenase maturation protein HypF